MSEPSFRKFVLKYTNIPQYRSPLDKTTLTYTVNFDIPNLLYFSFVSRWRYACRDSKNEFGIFVSKSVMHQSKERKIGQFCMKIWAYLGQPFQSYGHKCEYSRLCRVCATYNIIEKQEREQKVLSFTLKLSSSPVGRSAAA